MASKDTQRSRQKIEQFGFQAQGQIPYMHNEWFRMAVSTISRRNREESSCQRSISGPKYCRQSETSVERWADRLLLDACLIERSLEEANREFRQRPGWVSVPLRMLRRAVNFQSF